MDKPSKRVTLRKSKAVKEEPKSSEEKPKLGSEYVREEAAAALPKETPKEIPIKAPKEKLPEVPKVEPKAVEEVKTPVFVPRPPRVRKPKPIPKAVPTSDVLAQETTIALKTCSKYIAGWRHLKVGVPITAPKEVIATLRRHGYVK